MDVYLLLSKTDDETDAVLKELTRFSVRTVGSFAAYAALSVDSVGELREISERLAAVAPGSMSVLVSVEERGEMAMTSTSGGIPAHCIDTKTGQIDYLCLGESEPSHGLKATHFAAAQVYVGSGDRESVREQLAATGGVTAIGRLADPRRLLVEFGATDCELLSMAIDDATAIPEVARVRVGVAVRPLQRETSSAD